ncbi:MAG: MBL fold metallo-hydrolase [Oscillospiraceae bacterium]|nr:MBL fold metallo-hydrolase [Oscillospiraceae bacterium]
MSEFQMTVLIDNESKENLKGEWGLAIHINHRGKTILLDTGSGSSFSKNAEKLGLSLTDISYGVLSHAHFDHANGMAKFFSENTKAKFYLRKGSAENCYSKHGIFKKYIGIRRGTLRKYRDRISYVDGRHRLYDGAWLIPHETKGLEEIGRKANMFRKTENAWEIDDFAHEQSLVLETKRGLVIFNSCSHGGADNIITEIAKAFPGQKIYAIIGGFHLFRLSDQEIAQFANRVKQTGIEKVLTGHCTGKRAFRILKEILGDCAEEFYCGYTFTDET